MALTGNWNYPTSIKFGAGRISELPEHCRALGMTRPLLITDSGLGTHPIVEDALDRCEKAAMPAGLYCEVSGNPTGSEVDGGVAAYKAGGCDGVIAFGGGSGLDAAKAVALMVVQTRPMWDFEDVGDNWTRENTKGLPPVVAVPLLGTPTGRGPVLRSGARPGDWLLVTGPLGGSLDGRHLRFRPRVEAARRLHAAVDLHAMLDLSDGLSRDLPHLTTERGLGARLDAESIPTHADVPPGLTFEERLAHALHDGEDFELLLAVSPDDATRLLDAPPPGVVLTHVGEVTGEAGRCELRHADGRTEPLAALGFEHRF